MLIGLAASGAAEARGTCRGTTNAGCSGDKFEQIESDVLITAGAEAQVGWGFHAE
jgi:hypothetical protein